MRIVSLRAPLVCLLLVALPAAAAAQSSQSISGRVVDVRGEPWVVVQRFGRTSGSIEVRGPRGATRGELDAPGWMAAAASGDGVLVAIAQSGPAAVRAAWFPAEDGRPLRPRLVSIPRVAGRDFAPVGVSVTARPGGFAVLWQEGSTRDPNETWRTYEARLDGAGALIGAPRQLPQVPWPIADAAWVSGRYFLLLYYGTSAPERTRLAAVHVNDAGHPEEHPWWATREGLIGEARCVVAGERALALYRGGPDGGELLEADVTSGAWAREVPSPTSHGRIAPEDAYGARHDGQLRVERVDLRALR